jgi:hypothetical protein
MIAKLPGREKIFIRAPKRIPINLRRLANFFIAVIIPATNGALAG